MHNPLRLKLEQFASFTPIEGKRLDALVRDHTETYSARQDILTEGDRVRNIHVVLSGLAARYKLLDQGERQIMAFLVPATFATWKCSCSNRWITASARCPKRSAPSYRPTRSKTC